MLRTILAIVLILPALAQEQSVFRSDTRLVEVEVVVRDGKGPVRRLTQSDFEVFDNGKLQKIGTFGVVTSAGSLVDEASVGRPSVSGPVATKADLVKFRSDFESWRNRISGLVRDGKSKDDVTKVLVSEFGWALNGNPMRAVDGLMTELKR